MKSLKVILYILTMISTVSCQYKSSPTVSLKVEQDSDGTGMVDLLKIEITNTSSKKVYLTDFHLINYLKIYNSKGEDFTLKYLENESFENSGLQPLNNLLFRQFFIACVELNPCGIALINWFLLFPTMTKTYCLKIPIFDIVFSLIFLLVSQLSPL